MRLKMNDKKLVLANQSTVTVKMDAEDKKKLKELAKSEGVSLSDFVRMCINSYVDCDKYREII